MPVECEQRRAFTGLRRHHAAHVSSLRHSRHLRCHVLPGLSAIARHLHIAVIGSHPQHIWRQRRFAQRCDRGIFLHPVVARQCILVRGFSENLQLVAVHACGHVSAEPGPVISAIRRLEQIISAVVHRGVFVSRNGHRRIPLEAVVRLSRFRLRPDRSLLPGA